MPSSLTTKLIDPGPTIVSQASAPLVKLTDISSPIGLLARILATAVGHANGVRVGLQSWRAAFAVKR